MAAIEWTDKLALGVEQIDDTHREFVACVNAVADASDEDVVAALDALRAHTEAHFAQENRWMAETAFPPSHCHLTEHEGVLEVIREVQGYVAQGKPQVARVLARELASWFEGHAATMDAMLAQWLRAQDYAFDAPAAAVG